MKGIRFGIRQKIFLVLLLLILFFAGNSFVSFYYLNQNEEVTNHSNQVIQPSLLALKDFKILVSNSKEYTKSWVNVQMEDHADKWALRTLHRETFPKLNTDLSKLADKWESQAERDTLDAALKSFNDIIETQKSIMASLKSFDSYDDMMIRFDAESQAEDVASGCDKINLLIDYILEQQTAQNKISQDAILDTYDNLRFSNTTLGLIVIVISLVLTFFLSRSITRPIIKLREVIKRLSKGELPEDKLRKTNDEVGEMVAEMDILIDGLRKTSHFASDIGDGQLDANFTPLSNEDVLGNSLLSMRENLRNVAKEDERRNWANEGYARFSEILRNNDNLGLEDLSNRIVSELVKYLQVNQGWIYIVEKESEHDTKEFLELKGVYAYSKQKFVNQRIEMGEGLTGQCWQEGQMIYMNDVPDEYISISSGLGEANPTSILIMPLKVNDEIYGIMEIAAFKDIEKYEIDFIERVTENIASTISVTKINERTKHLLEESQMLTENMKTQEEEMRQNFEELQSTQEELSRREKEKEHELETVKAELSREIEELKKQVQPAVKK